MSRHIVTMRLRADDGEPAGRNLLRALNRADFREDQMQIAEIEPGSWDVTCNLTLNEDDVQPEETLTYELTKAGLSVDVLTISEIPLAAPSSIVDAVAEAIRQVIPAHGIEERVAERFPDEIADFRDGDGARSFTVRGQDQWKLRTERAAQAAVAALINAGVLRPN